MILVDSSVWIDYFNSRASSQTNYLHQCLGVMPIVIGDIILAEVLRGFRSDRAFSKAKELLSSLFYYDMLGKDVALHSVDIYRRCRRKGVTIKKPVDLYIASFCILNGFSLLHADQDFELIRKHTTLETVIL